MPTISHLYQEIDRVNCLLPYADQLDVYADIAWRGIKSTFAHMIESKSFSSELPHILKALNGYVQLFGHRFTKEEHIALIKFYISMGLCPLIDDNVADATLTLACEFIRGVNWTLCPNAIELDWRAFDNASITLPPSMDLRFCNADDKDYRRIKKALRLYKRFFPISCIQEIWEESRSSIYFMARYGPHENIFDKLLTFTPIGNSTFDEINRIWLGEIFTLWYKYADENVLHQEIICLLGLIASCCPGRVDWEPHLDRIFNGLIKDFCIDVPGHGRGELSKLQNRLANGYARILIWAIVPNSTVISRMECAFKVLANLYHPSTDDASMLFFVVFCKQLLANLVNRLRNELCRNPLSERLYGKAPKWNRITASQLDLVVDLLLPVCLDNNLYARHSRSVQAALVCVDHLCTLRPHRVIPRLLAALETGFEMPEAPMRVTRPLQALAETAGTIGPSIRFPLAWPVSELGRQPGDQVSPKFKAVVRTSNFSEEDCRFLQSHITGLLHTDGRTQITRILRLCLAGLDINDIDRLEATVKALSSLFLTTPMQDFSDVCLPNLSEDYGSSDLSNQMPILNNYLVPEFAASRIAISTLEMEELTLQVYTRLLSCLQSVNESLLLIQHSTEGGHLHGGSESGSFRDADCGVPGPGEAEAIGLPPGSREARVICALTGLGVALGISASRLPRLRLRLIACLSDAVFGQQWCSVISRALNYQLLWLLIGKQGTRDAKSGAENQDVVLQAVGEFWPRFLRLFVELDKENGLTFRGRAEPRFLGLLNILPAYITSAIPSRLIVPRIVDEFVRPLIDVLSRLLAISLGGTALSDGYKSTSSESCFELALSASTSAGVLLHRLTAFAINMDAVDFYSTRTDLSSSQSPFITSPIWSPFISWQELLLMTKPQLEPMMIDPKILAKNLWYRPTVESFALAEYATRSLLLPTLDMLLGANSELQSCVASNSTPSLRITTGLSLLLQQRQFFTCCITWVHFLTVGLAEGLAPRVVTDDHTSNTAVPELELRSDQSVLLPPLPDYDGTQLIDFQWFELADGSPLRERIFRVGEVLLQTLTVIAEQFDVQPYDISSSSTGDSALGMLITQTGFRFLVQFTFLASHNENSDEGGPFYVLLHTDLSHLTRGNLGASSCCLQAGNYEDGILPHLLKITGPSTSLLKAYSQGLMPTDDSDWFVNAHLPLAWLVQAQRRHRLFVSICLVQSIGYRGHSRLGLTQMGRICMASEFLDLTKTLARLTAVCNSSAVRRMSNAALSVWCIHRVPGALNITARTALETLRSVSSDSFVVGECEAAYQVRKQTVIKAVALLGDIFQDSRAHLRVFKTDPHLWSEVWVQLAKTAIFTDVANNIEGNEQPKTGTNNLTSINITHRYADQEALNAIIGSFFSVFHDKFPFRLYQPVYDLSMHPNNGFFTPVLRSADALLRILSVPKSASMPQQPILGTVLMGYRREAYVNFANNMYSECLAKFGDAFSRDDSCSGSNNVAPNSGLVAIILSRWLFPCDPPLSPTWEPNCRLAAPPPPPPPIGVVRLALRLLTDFPYHNDLVQGALHFLFNFLQVYYVRYRPDDLRPFDVKAIARAVCPTESAMDYSNSECWPGLRNDNFGIVFDPDHNCLATDTDFAAYHHIPHIITGFVHYLPRGVWRYPLHCFNYPCEFSYDWLTPRADVDFTGVSAAEREGINACLVLIFTHLASPRRETRLFWHRLMRNILFIHRLQNSSFNSELSEFINLLCDCFGPEVILPLFEELVLSILVPTSAEIDYSDMAGFSKDQSRPLGPLQSDGIVEMIGPSIASDFVLSITVGAFSWPRKAKQHLFSRVLPRLLVAIEAASLSASVSPAASCNFAEDRLHALENVAWSTAALVFGNGEQAMDSPLDVDDQPSECELRLKPSSSRNLSSDQLMYYVLNPRGTAYPPDIRQTGGPRLRLSFGYKYFVRNYVNQGHTYLQYLAPLSVFARRLYLDKNASSIDLVAGGEHMDTSALSGCSHESTESTDDPCPICFALRLLPSSNQRAFFGLHFTLALTQSLRWQGVKLFTRIFPSPELVETTSWPVSWADLAFSPAVWHREIAAHFSIAAAAVLFESVIGQLPPLTHTYSWSGGTPQVRQSFVANATDAFKITEQGPALSIISNLRANYLGGQNYVFKQFLPLLVRDSVAMLYLRGIQPSAQSLAVQDLFISQSLQRLTPASQYLVRCSTNLKWVSTVQLKSRLGSLFVCLPGVLIYAFPNNPTRPVDGSCPLFAASSHELASRFSILLALAPLLADLVSTSNLFWTGGRSGANRESAAFSSGGFGAGGSAGEMESALDTCLGIAINEIARQTCGGTHTDRESARAGTSAMLGFIRTFVDHPAWKTRAFGLLVIRVLPLANIAAFWCVSGDSFIAEKSAVCEELGQIVTLCLADPWIEVSRAASEALSCLVQFNILQVTEAWISALVLQAHAPLIRNADSTVVSASVRTRHAGILGLCAIVRANVHDTPDYLPVVIAELAEHAYDPQPIRKSVSDTLMAYSRSHQERWLFHDRLKFSESQLDAYSSVVSAVSYYV